MDTLTSPPKKSKSRALGIVTIVALLLLVVVVDMKRRQAEEQVAQLSMKMGQVSNGNEQQNREAAQRIVDQVRKHIDIPTDVEPTVATIVDVTELRKRNAFYNKANNGNYLIVTKDRAILFDASKDKVIDVVPVQIEDQAAAASSSSAKSSRTVPKPASSAPAANDTSSADGQ